MCQWGEEEIKFHSICITRASGKHRSAETGLWKLKYRIEMKELAPVCLLLAKMWCFHYSLRDYRFSDNQTPITVCLT